MSDHDVEAASLRGRRWQGKVLAADRSAALPTESLLIGTDWRREAVALRAPT
jgi:hypothetical protein